MIPKFRVFEKDRKIMCKLEELVFGENGDLQKISYYWEEYGEYLSTSEIGDVILMQYTGLKDKRGNDIYKGDIVKESIGRGEYLFVEVAYADGCFLGKERGYEPEYPISHFLEGEIIGNIYEHSHLLKENTK